MIVCLDIVILEPRLSLYYNGKSIVNCVIEPWNTGLNKEFEFLLSIDSLKENIIEYCLTRIDEVEENHGRIRIIDHNFNIEESTLIYMKMKYPNTFDSIVKIDHEEGL